MLSDLVSRVQPSATVALTGKVAEMRAAGREVIGLGAGEPDFATPPHIVEAAKAALDQGYTRYTAPDGILPLKEAVVAKFERENGLTYDPKTEISISSGGKQALFNALLATVGPGDEVIIPAPYWVSYPDIVRLAGGTPKIIETTADTGYRVDPDRLAEEITPHTKWLILNSPSNPTGAMYDKHQLMALAEVLRRNPHVHVLTDEIYEHIVYEGAHHLSIVSCAPDLKDRSLIVNGVSKAYSMTGFRLGYAAGPKKLITAMRMIQSQSTTNPSSISQHAAIAALEGPQSFLDDWRSAFERRRDMVVDALNRIDGISCPNPQGAFYVYPSISDLIGQHGPAGVIKDDLTFASQLLEECGIAVVAGTAFGSGPAFRISFAVSDETLAEACSRITKFCAALSA